MPNKKHTPMRTCIVCRTNSNKHSLTRIVRTADNNILVDPSGKQPGRGAYVCSSSTCWDTIIQKNILSGALRTNITNVHREGLAQYREQQLGIPE